MPDQFDEDDFSPEMEESPKQSAPQKKVELDLDDAPFLKTEEKAPPPAPVDDLPPEVSEEDIVRRKKRRLIIIAVCAGLVILTAVAVWWFFFRIPPPPPPEAPQPEVIVVPSAQAPAGPTDLVREFAPFVVPVKEANGATAFLVCKFSAITQDPVVREEMTSRLVPLRDAVYYYLRGKDNSFLLDHRNGDEIKKDLLAVFNDYLSQGKLEDIVFETYLTR